MCTIISYNYKNQHKQEENAKMKTAAIDCRIKYFLRKIAFKCYSKLGDFILKHCPVSSILLLSPVPWLM